MEGESGEDFCGTGHGPFRALIVSNLKPVSYTHLDVYKRQMLERIRKQSSPHSLVYFNRKNGSTLKSATIPIIGEGGRIIGLSLIHI